MDVIDEGLLFLVLCDVCEVYELINEVEINEVN